MHAKVVSLKGIQFEGEIKLLNVKTQAGEITVLPGHRPLIATLASGPAYIIDTNGKQTNLSFSGGVLHVDHEDKVSVLVD